VVYFSVTEQCGMDGGCSQVLGDGVTSSTERCSDVMVAGEAQLQQVLVQEVAQRKAAEHRADCLRQLLCELRSRKVCRTARYLSLYAYNQTDYATALSHAFSYFW